MDKLISKITQLGVNLDSNSLIEVAKYWFWKEVVCDLLMTLAFMTLFSLIFTIIKNFGTGKWKC